jgi:FHA domain/WD40-like Beta Propeller Repeat
VVEDSTQRNDSTIVGPPLAPILEVVRGNEQSRIIRLKLKTRIGRERDNELILTDPRVSRYHSIIELDDGKWVIRDQESANGTFVNGRRISAGRVLQPDDHVVLGDTELVFQPSRVGSGARVAPTSPEAAAMPARKTAVPEAAPTGASPSWGWRWIMAGAIVVVALLVIAVYGGMQGFIGQKPPGANVTTVPIDAPQGDFVLAYEDDFSNPNSGWDDAFDRYTVKQYGNNRYYIEIATSNLVAWGLANRDVADFRLEVETTQESGPNNNGYGVLFRFTDRDNYYRFDVSGEGYFLLSKYHQGEWTTLVPWTASSALNVGQAANTLMVEAIGDRIRLFANGTEIGQATDKAHAHGNFGFFANTFTDPNLIVSFDDIKLWVPRGEAVAVIPTVTPARTLKPVAVVPTGTATFPQEHETVTVSGSPAAPTTEVTRTTAATSTVTVRQESTLTVTKIGPTATRATATVTVTPMPTATPIPTATTAPLPDYTSRDVPLARNAVQLGGRLYFPVYDSEAGTYNIFAANPDGSDRQLVVEEASQPAVNSDGQRIAFRSWKHDNRGLIERGVSGDSEWRFNSFLEAARPVFAPDNQSFMFHSREAGEQAAIYRTIGTQHEVLRREGVPIQGQSPAWVNATAFVYQGCMGSDCGLIFSSLDGSFPKQLTQDPGDTNPDVSPGGQQIVFMSRRSGNWDIYQVGIDGSNLVQLTSDSADDGLPIWSDDGKTVAFVSDRDGAWEMWAMDADGDNQRPLFDLGGSIDGTVRLDVQNSRGWAEERIDWAP